MPRSANQVAAAEPLRLPSRAGFGREMNPMKKLATIFTVVLTAAIGRAALPQPDLLAQIHFAGAQKISTGKDAALFNRDFGSPEALALRTQTADKLSLSHRTVERHMDNARSKLGARNRPHLVRKAIASGQIRIGTDS